MGYRALRSKKFLPAVDGSQDRQPDSPPAPIRTRDRWPTGLRPAARPRESPAAGSGPTDEEPGPGIFRKWS